jgi:hypothetical protein
VKHAWKRGGKVDRQRLSDNQMLALPLDPCRTQRCLQQPAHGSETAGKRLLGQQRTG